MFNPGRFVAVFNIRNRMRTAGVSNQQTVTLRIIAGIFSSRTNFNQAAVGLIGKSGRNAFGNNFGAGIFTDMNHFVPVSACWRLLVMATE